MSEILPEHNAGLSVIPQLMVKDVNLCLEGIRFLEDLGYPEVNLNLGCPSGVVMRKGKGAALLEVFRQLPLSIRFRKMEKKTGLPKPGDFNHSESE